MILGCKTEDKLGLDYQTLLKQLPSKAPIYLPTDKIPMFDRIRGIEHVIQIYKNDLDAIYRPRLRALRGKYKDHKRCFLIGNGPSLNRTDLAMLKDEVTFAVNGFFLKTEELGWRPTFYCVEDHLVAEDRAPWINDFQGPIKFFPAYLGYMFPQRADTIFYNHRPRKSYPKGFDFSLEADKITYTGCTVTFSMMQLAAYLGFREIYLIGVDASYEIPSDAKEGKDYGVGILDMQSDDPNHFDPDYFGKGFRWHDPQVHKMIEAYEEARHTLEGTGQTIYNATIGGKLEVFERRDFNEIFPSSRTSDQVERDNEVRKHLKDAVNKSSERSGVTAPRLLVIDMTAMGGGTATGEVKAGLLAGWPEDRLLQVAADVSDRLLLVRPADDAYTTTEAGEVEIRATVAAFQPELILYRPVPQKLYLHKLALSLLETYGDVPLVTWIMDDWPARLQMKDQNRFAQLDGDLRNLLGRSVVRLSICEAMSKAFSERYGHSFVAYANGIDPDLWREAKEHKKGPVVLRYAGGLAPDMNVQSVLRVAHAVEKLAAEGHAIRFEISTRPLWEERSGELFKELKATSLDTTNRSMKDYIRLLQGADLLLIAYNYDTESLRYVRYSMANKLPECLASGAVVLAHGPRKAATIDYLGGTEAAVVVTEVNSQALKGTLLDLIKSPKRRNMLATKARQLAFSAHDIRKLRAGMLNLFITAAKGKTVDALSMEAARTLSVSHAAPLEQIQQIPFAEVHKVTAQQSSDNSTNLWISIISPSFNQVQFLDLMTTSVQQQTYEFYEHIILDPGSKDGSIEKLHCYANTNNHVRLVLEPDRGQIHAINKGLAQATGDILTWLNTDDYYIDDEALHTVAEYFSLHPDIDVAYGRGLRVDPDGGTICEAFVHQAGTDFTQTLEHSIGLLQPALFFRRSVYEKLGALDESWPLQLDYELWIRFAQAGCNFGFIDRLLCKATVHQEAKSTLLRQRQLNECLTLVAERFGYVASDWISRYSEFFLTQRDSKTERNIQLSADQVADRSSIERDLHRRFNVAAVAAGRLVSTNKARRRTLEAMTALCVTPPAPRRTIITSFDSHYFQQGLNLIASLHRTSIDSFDRILVYPLGLSQFERGRLADLEKVELVDYPEDLPAQTFPDFLEPKARAYKAYVMRSTPSHILPGDLVLWMDAGLSALQDIGQVFELVDQHDFFMTDHDNVHLWPFFFNIFFTHPECCRILQPSNAELLAPHYCSALVGYRAGGRFQKIIDEAWEIGRVREAVVWPKNIPVEEKKSKKLNKEDRILRDDLIHKRTSPEAISQERLLELFAYYGHRTQSVLSILAYRYQAPVFSAEVYRQANKASSEAASRNWDASAKETDQMASHKHLDDVTEETIVYHHRGIYHHLEGLQFRKEGGEIFVLGNGPSLRGFDFDRLKCYDSLGMNAAYRFWDISGFYPTYYACFDTVVQDSHHIEIRRLIREREKNGIKRFFLRENILEKYPELAEESSVFILEDLQRTVGWFSRDKITTGSFSVLVGLYLGYRRIYLLGIDLNYVEKLPEARVDGRALEIDRSPETNPNYFFDSYQIKGDRYNPPNRHPDMHLRSWRQLKEFLDSFPATIINLNPVSAVRDFPFENFENLDTLLHEFFLNVQTLAELAVQKKRERGYWRLAILNQIKTRYPAIDPFESSAKITDSAGVFRVVPGSHFKQISINQWTYTHSDAQHKQWHVVLDNFNVVSGTVCVGCLTLIANRELTVQAWLARDGNNTAFEGVSQLVKLAPGIAQTIMLRKEFAQPHNAVRLQVNVKEFEGGSTANLTINNLAIVETLESMRKSIGAFIGNIATANKTFRAGDYRTALCMYLLLNQQRPLKMYSDNALMAARRLGMGWIKSPEELQQLVC